MSGSLSGIFFPICSVFFALLLCVVYFSKKRINIAENKFYSLIIISILLDSICSLILQVLSYDGVNEIDMIYGYLINKIDFICLIIYATSIFMYVLTITLPLLKKNLQKTVSIVFIIDIIISLIVLFTKLDIITESSYISIAGLSAGITYVTCGLYIFMSIIITVINHKRIDRRYLPIIFIAFLIILILALYLANPYLVIISIILTFNNYIMYFTIENPDLKMVNELEIAKLQAEKSNQAKSDFLSSMSHEIRTPLNAIVGLTDIIKKSNDLDEIHEDAIDVSNASQNLLEIVNGILDISKIEAEKMELVESEYDFNEILYNTQKMISNRLISKNKDIVLECNFDSGIPSKLIGDKIKIQQIMLNLLTNAVKYTDHGKIEFIVKCTKENDLCKLVITIKDTGRGIKKEQMDNLFTKFNRLDSDMNTNIEGTGLGLAITKGLVDLMNGKIKVESEFEKGSTFTVFINQKTGNNNYKVVSETEEKIPENKKILIVDDNKLNIKVAKKVLSDMNIQSEGVESGFECIEKIKNGDIYDLILMDIMMPKMSGVETLNKLKEISNFNIPVVAFTADAMEGQEKKYLNDGFDGYITKPVNKDRLTKLLNGLFSGNELNEKEKVKQVESDKKIHQVLPITDEDIEKLNKLIGLE